MVCISIANLSARLADINLDESQYAFLVVCVPIEANEDTVSNGENGTLSSSSAPLFASLFPERDRSCHLMVHENSDNGAMYRTPLGYREGRPLSGVMALQNFIDGGHDVIDAKILLVVKSIGAKKKGKH